MAAGFEGREARSAASRALSSAFLAAWAAFLASSASALVFDLAPLDQFAASSRSSCSCCFAIRASWAAAFYCECQRRGIARGVVYFGVAGCLLCVFAKFLWHRGDDFSWDDEADRPNTFT